MNAPTILLIEDSPEDAELIVAGLSRVVPGSQVTVISNGQDAVDFFRRCGTPAGHNPRELPAFVLLDLNLPQVSGLDILKEIRQQPATRLLPVTVLSASDRLDDVRAATGLGANSFIHKPVAGDELRNALIDIAHYWLDLNVPPPSARH